MNKPQQEISLWLSLATLPCLIGYLGVRLGMKALEEIGRNSEEIFRGDRLPVLHLSPERQEGQ